MVNNSPDSEISDPEKQTRNYYNENRYISVCLIFMALDFAAANYVGSILYGIPIVAMQIIILKILAKRWGVEEHTDFSNWLPGPRSKKEKTDE